MAKLIYQIFGLRATVCACINRVLAMVWDYFIRPPNITLNPPEYQSPKDQGAKILLSARQVIYKTNPAKPPLIEYRKVCAKYSLDNADPNNSPDQADALKDVSFSIYPRERIGIVGPSASGKSTLLCCLLEGVRNIKVSSDSSILLNGANIEDIDRLELRNEITYISEDSGLLRGSVWHNINPDGSVDDDTVMSSFMAVKEPISEWSDSRPSVCQPSNSKLTNPLRHIYLDTVLDIGGTQLTPSQRQLIALARAIAHHKSNPVRHSHKRIVLLDDPISSLDAETNTVIQDVIRREFRTCTTIMVSNNLANVIDYDCIIVMKEGMLLEKGSPKELVVDDLGAFAKMVKDATSAGLALKKVGFDWEGYDLEGVDEFGFDAQGFNKVGWDKAGYDSSGFGLNGCNRYGKTLEEIEEAKEWYEQCNFEMIMDRMRKRELAAEIHKRMTAKLGKGYGKSMSGGMMKYVEIKREKIRRKVCWEMEAMRQHRARRSREREPVGPDQDSVSDCSTGLDISS